MTIVQQIIRHLLQDELGDTDDFDMKELDTYLPADLENAGFTPDGPTRWVFRRSEFMILDVRKEAGEEWSAAVYSSGILLNHIKGPDTVVRRWLEEIGFWPEGTFTRWNKFAASARGKGIRDQTFGESEDEGSEWKEVTDDALVDRLIRLGFKPSDYFQDSWVKAATRIGLGNKVLGSVHLRRRTDRGFKGAWDVEIWYMGSKLETMHGVPDEDVLTKLRALPRTRDLDVIGESEDELEGDWKEVVNPNILEEVKREFVISVVEQEDFSREALQKALVKLGVPAHTGNLIAIEWGGSQAIVNRRYLAGVGLAGSVLDSVQQFIKFAYRLQYEEDLIEKLYDKYTAP